mgnify:CR=1 FL=1
MKKILIAAGLAVASLAAMASPNVGVSVSVGQPGFYGRIDVGNAPPPRVVYAEPVIVHRPPPVLVHRPPIYLRVPPGHQKRWSRYCDRYGACGQPVYFVRDDWYRDHYRDRHVRRAPPPRVVVVDHHPGWRDHHRRDDHRDGRRDRDDRHDRGHHGGHGRSD